MILNIIIPVFNQWVFTNQCLKDLLHLDKRHNIIIVNNGSTDGTADKLKNSFDLKSQYTVIQNEKNIGYSKANNLGFKLCKEDDNILFLNNDVRVLPSNLKDWTNSIFELCDKYENTIFSPNAGLLDDNYNFVYETENENAKWNYLSGWCLFSKYNTFKKLANNLNQEGPFWEGTFAYFEDTYMGFQAKKLGINMRIAKLNIKHIGRQTGKTMNLPVMYNSAREIFINELKNII